MEEEVKGQEQQGQPLEPKDEEPLEAVREETEEVVPVERPLEERLKEREEELNQMKDRYLRLYAEFENYKRRVQKDKEELVKYALEPFVKDLLNVVDNLERALEHAENEDAVAALREGVELTLKEFRKILNKYEVREIEALGKPFDPFYHDAMSQIEREDVEDKTVVEEYRKGYMLKDKVIRPSLVGVSKKVEPSSEGESEQKDK